MDKEWVEQTLRGIKANDWRIDNYEENWASIMAAAIAQAHEEELAAAQTQVAVMAGTLQHIKDGWFDKWYPADIFVGGPDSDEGVNDVVVIREMVVQALSAAPKVVWHGKGTAEVVSDDWENDRTTFIAPEHEDGIGVEILSDKVCEDGQQVEVFVCSVEPGCQGHREQPSENALQTDCEAETPDSEQPCLVDTFAELRELIGAAEADGVDVVAWVREIRGSEEEE